MRRNNQGRPRRPSSQLPPGHKPASYPLADRPPESLRDTAYELIKHRITTCAFKPGDYINETYVSELIGIGRTPVHQAIDRLMLEGMVEVIPRKGVIVKPISLDEILQIIQVRILNECYCAKLAAEKAERQDILQLSDILERARAWGAARSTEQLMLLDREFHHVLARASRNAVLGEHLGRLHDRSLRFWFISLDTPGHQASVQDQHELILSAIKDRDSSGAEAAMRSHIESFRENIMRHI